MRPPDPKMRTRNLAASSRTSTTSFNSYPPSRMIPERLVQSIIVATGVRFSIMVMWLKSAVAASGSY